MTELIRVVMVRTVVTPRPTRAGAAPLFNQNETQDITTIRLLGIYTLKQYIQIVQKALGPQPPEEKEPLKNYQDLIVKLLCIICGSFVKQMS